MTKFVRYTHAASTGYDANISHELDEVVKAEGIDRVKMLFSPIDFKWEDLESPKVEEAVIEEAKKENHRRSR